MRPLCITFLNARDKIEKEIFINQPAAEIRGELIRDNITTFLRNPTREKLNP